MEYVEHNYQDCLNPKIIKNHIKYKWSKHHLKGKDCRVIFEKTIGNYMHFKYKGTISRLK